MEQLITIVITILITILPPVLPGHLVQSTVNPAEIFKKREVGVRNSRSILLPVLLAGGGLVLSCGVASAITQTAKGLPAQPLLADPLLTNPLVVGNQLQGACWGGSNCQDGGTSASQGLNLVSTGTSESNTGSFFAENPIKPSGGSAVVSPPSVPSSTQTSTSSAGNSTNATRVANSATSRGGTNVTQIPQASGGSADVTPPPILGADGVTANSGGSSPNELVEASNSTTGPLSELGGEGGELPEQGALIVGFLNTDTVDSPNLVSTFDPVSPNDLPEAASIFLVGGGLLLLGAARRVRRRVRAS